MPGTLQNVSKRDAREGKPPLSQPVYLLHREDFRAFEHFYYQVRIETEEHLRNSAEFLELLSCLFLCKYFD